jgi:hypothetical protein
MAYRIKELMYSNVPHDVRVGGMFAINGATGALTAIVRPSAGGSAAPGAGNQFTVTQPTANKFLWQVTLAERFISPVWADAQVMLTPTAGNAGTGGFSTAAVTVPAQPGAALKNNGGTAALGCYSTALDAPSNTTAADGSNSFYIFLADNTGTIPTTALTVPANYTVMVNFEACFKGAVSPTSL